MNLSDVPKFDPAALNQNDLADLQDFADRCVAATTVDEIEAVGAELDQRRAVHRANMKYVAARSRSVNALYKRLIQEVPRRFGAELGKALKEREEEA